MLPEAILSNWFAEPEEIVKAISSYKKYLKEKLEHNQQ